MEPSDVEQLIRASERVNGALEFEPREVAQILCEELERIAHQQEEYWRDLQEASESLATYRVGGEALLANLEDLIDLEVEVFNRLGFSEEDSGGVISRTYDALSIVRDIQDPSPASVRNLRDRLEQAQDLVCRLNQSRLKRAFNKYIGLKGSRFLAGAAICGANVLFAVAADGGSISFASFKVGIHVMRGNTDGLIDMANEQG